jgi:hypothetical protein
VLQKLVSEFREKTGHLPSRLLDLKTAGFLSELPIDPLGNPYKLMPDGRVEVHNPDDFPFITAGTPTGYVAPPPHFLPSDSD